VTTNPDATQPPPPLLLDLFILKVLPKGCLEVRILKDLFAPKQGNFGGVLELRILKELAKQRGELLPTKSIP